MTRFRLSNRSWAIFTFGLVSVAVMYTLIAAKVGGDAGALWISDVGETALVGLSAAFILYVAKRLGFGTLGRPWLWIGLGCASFAVGDAVWSFTELGLGQQVSYPGLPDVFYVLVYPLMAIGLIRALLNYRGLVDMRIPVAAAATTAVVIGGAMYFAFLNPFVLSQGLSAGEAALSSFYPLADVFFALAPALAVAFVIVRLGGGRLGWSWWAVILGVLVFSTADSAYSYLAARDLYVAGTLVDFGWVLANASIAFGAAIALDLAEPASWR